MPDGTPGLDRGLEVATVLDDSRGVDVSIRGNPRRTGRRKLRDSDISDADLLVEPTCKKHTDLDCTL
jgi:hypothetical protein